jgi:Raf kinase inhibitor-like YbhB/YbcL family protein
MTFEMKSTSFSPGQPIPKKHTCDGPDLSTPLAWSDSPSGTKSFALIADDPDAPMGTWVHWVLYDLPADTRNLAEGIPKTETLPDGTMQGRNDFGRIGYGGPCPPTGKAHRYFFKLYALDQKTGLRPGAAKSDLLAAIKNHLLAETQLMGTYKR